MAKAAQVTRRMGLALGLLLAVLPHAASAASPDYATIELHGSESGYVDVRFDEPIRIICCTDTVSPGEERPAVPPLSVRTRGTFAGYIVERLSDGKIVAGGVRVPGMDWDDKEGSYKFRWIVRLKRGGALLAPGLYRIHLVTDRESTVRFRVDGLDQDESYRPKSSTTVTSSFKTPLVESGQPVSHHRTPVHVDEDTWVVLASLLVAERNQASYMEHCVVQLIEPCQSRDDYSGAASLDPVSNIWSLSAIYSVYRPGHFAPGEWQAQFSVASAGLVQKAQTLVLTIDLPARHTAGPGADGDNGTGRNQNRDRDRDDDTDRSPPGGTHTEDQDNSGGASGSSTPSGVGGSNSSSIAAAPGSSLPFTGGNVGLYVALALNIPAVGALLIGVTALGRSQREALHQSVANSD